MTLPKLTNDSVLLKVLEETASAQARFLACEKAGSHDQEAIDEYAKAQMCIEKAIDDHVEFGSSGSIFFGDKQLNRHGWVQGRNAFRYSALHGPKKTVEWLRRIGSVEKTSLRYCFEVFGLKLRKKIQFSNGVHIAPLRDAPKCQHVKILTEAHLGPRPMISQTPMHPPVIAWLETENYKGSQKPKRSSDPFEAARNDLNRTLKSLAIGDDLSPVISIGWTDYVDLDLVHAEFGLTWMSSRHEGGLDNLFPNDVTNDHLDWVEAYLRLPEVTKRKVDIAAARIGQARSRTSVGDIAIDGAIALEALMSDGNAQELTFKLRTRVARFLEEDFDGRHRVREALKQFYDIRSAVVHGGPPDRSADRAKVIVGLTLASQVLQKIVASGNVPDFNKLELG